MSGRESYGVVPNLNPNPSPNSSQQAGSGSTAAMAGISLAFGADGSAVYQPIMATSPTYQPPPPPPPPAATDGSSVSPATNTAEPMKRKRGRPRKYADGSMGISLPIQSQPQTAAAPSGVLSSPPSVEAPSSSGKKARGRPPGSGQKHKIAASGPARFGFTPHVITVKAGEDVSSKISSLSQNGPQAVCILSANGAISNVTLHQAAMSGGTVTYEGRFEILSLSGSSLLTESGGQRSRTGGLSISLAGPDGRVLGGGVAGPLTAASPVQIIVGSFIADGKDSKSGNQSEPSSVPSKLVAGASAAGSPPSHGNLSESSGGGLGSPLNRSTGTYNNNNNSNPQGMTNMAWK